jgi:hypothetical protein
MGTVSFTTFRNMKIFFVDLWQAKADEVIPLLDETQKIVTAQPPESMYIFIRQ